MLSRAATVETFGLTRSDLHDEGKRVSIVPLAFKRRCGWVGDGTFDLCLVALNLSGQPSLLVEPFRSAVF